MSHVRIKCYAAVEGDSRGVPGDVDDICPAGKYLDRADAPANRHHEITGAQPRPLELALDC